MKRAIVMTPQVLAQLVVMQELHDMTVVGLLDMVDALAPSLYAEPLRLTVENMPPAPPFLRDEKPRTVIPPHLFKQERR